MKLNIQGNSPLYLPRDPVSPMEAATKSYVDVNLSNHETRQDLHLTAAQNTWIDSLLASAVEINYLQGVTSGVQGQIDARLALAGGTMTGALVLAGLPAAGNEAANKSYVDSQVGTGLSNTGGTLTGYLVLHADPVALMQAATKKYVDESVSLHADSAELHLTALQNTWIDAITVTSSEVNHLEGVTSGVQGQLNAKVELAGGTMTGPLTLSGGPVEVGHAVTKKYADDALALKLAKAGGTLSGQVKTPLDPVAAEDLARKGYVDQRVEDHASSNALHLTADQNTWIDAITASAQEINHLQGLTSGAQEQLNTKFNKAGGEITGDVTLAEGKAVFVSKLPATDNELVNKAYVDSKVLGQEWKDPVSASNLVNDSLSTPPAVPVKGDVYIVGTAATAEWMGKEGFAATFNGTAWVFLQGRAIAADDRFGVRFTTDTVAAGGVETHAGKIVTLVSGGPGAYVWAAQDITAGSATLVFDPQAGDFGVTYTFTDEGSWVATNTSVNLTAGDGLSITGNLLSVNVGNGLTILDDAVVAKLDPTSGLEFNAGAIHLKIKAAQLQVTGDGLSLSNAIAASIADAVPRSGASTVTGSVAFATGADLTLTDAPVAPTDAVNKLFVDGVQGVLQGEINAVVATVEGLSLDAVTKQYVDDEVVKKVAKEGDTMTGFLTLNAAPTTVLHAATKGYVDTAVSDHTADVTIHVTPAQKTFLNALTVSASEVNELANVTSNVQEQINVKVNRAGDTMTGELVLSAEPVNALGAVPKQQLEAGLALKVNKAGDSMTGFLALHAAPTADTHAATKKYVDEGLSTHTGNESLHLTAVQNTWMDAIAATSDEINHLQGVTSGVQAQINAKLALAGGVMSGPLVLDGPPTANNHPATKKYADDALALKLNLTGGVMSGPIELPADPVTPTQAARMGYVDAQVVVAKSYADGKLEQKVAKAGDTMTGFLTLHAAPASDLHAATKKYVDEGLSTLSNSVDSDLVAVGVITTGLRGDVDGLLVDPVTKSYVDTQDGMRLSKSGGVMTGYLTLHADPTSPMQPSTKQYVDAVAQGLITKPSVRFATTAALDAQYNNGAYGVNSTLTATANGILTVDGGTPLVGDRILVRMQANESHNGDYVVQQSGDVNSLFILKRVTTVDESSEVPGSYYYVFDGATLKGTGWVFTVDNPVTFTIGTDPIAVNQFSGQGSMIAGAGLTLDGNTMTVGTVTPSRIVVNADNIDLAVTGVTPGGYTKVMVDGYGRVTSGSNPNTLAGQGIADGQLLNANLTSLSLVADAGLLVRTTSNDIETRKLAVAGVGLTVSNDGSGTAMTALTITSNASAAAGYNTVVARDASGNFEANVVAAELTGNASTATALKTSRNVGISGDIVAANVVFNGTADVALVSELSATGVVAGTYTKVTVDAKGRLTVGENPTTVAGYGLVDAATITYVNTMVADLESKLMELQAYVMSRI